MQSIVAGWWGAAFGTAGLMMAGAVAAYLASLRRVALMAASASVLYTSFAASYLGVVFDVDAGARLRLDATMFMLCSVLLGHLVLAMIGHLRQPAAARRWRSGLYGFGILVTGSSWLAPAAQGFALCTVGGFLLGAVALVLCIRRAQRGDRLAGVSIVGVLSICVSCGALTLIALGESTRWEIHAVGAIAGMAYLCVIAIVLWLRFSYLIELRQVMSHGAAYDPITRMRTHSETGRMVGFAFFQHLHAGTLVGVMAVSVGNLYTLERLHGRAAVNHGLFVSAGRLRRTLPGGAEAGRLGDDGFLVLVRDVDDVDKLVELAHSIVQHLSRPVALSTSVEPGELESGQARWVAQVGVGIVVTGSDDRPSAAIERARAISRAAWGFPSRVGWEEEVGHVAEAPQLTPA